MARSPRILLMPSPVSSGSVGTVTKSIGLARQLQARGCQVCIVLGGKLASLVTSSGFEVLDCPVPQYASTTYPILNIVDFIQWTGMADATFVAQSIASEMQAVKTFRPDVIFAEARPTAAIVAAATHVPLVTIASWPMHPLFPANQAVVEQPSSIFNQHLRHYHCTEIQHVAELLFLRSDLCISPSLPELEPDLQALPGVHFVGYMLDLAKDTAQIPSWFAQWQDKPLILVYLSVGAITPAIYLRTLPEAFQDLPVNVLCACGFHFHLQDTTFESAQKNVRFVDFIPIQTIIEHAQLVIFHGGQDTMLMTLLHRLPSLTIPGQHFERKYNAEQLARTGTSQLLPIHAFRAHRLRRAAQDILQGNDAHKSLQLQQRLQQAGGTERAVELIMAAGS